MYLSGLKLFSKLLIFVVMLSHTLDGDQSRHILEVGNLAACLAVYVHVILVGLLCTCTCNLFTQVHEMFDLDPASWAALVAQLV